MKNKWLDETALLQEQEHGRVETRLLRGLRMRAIRQAVQSMERLQRWSFAALHKPWPTSVAEHEDYLHDLASDERRGTSSYARARFGVVYAEVAADLPAELRLGDSAALHLCIKELSLRSSKKNLAPKREANQYLTAVLMKMEKVVTGGHELFIRAYAWLKLVTIWAVLRGEDSTWIDADSLKFTAGEGLAGNLTKSKTTGPGKKTKHREIVVSVGAYVLEPDWLESGWKLWGSAPRPRQNFIALPDPTFEQFRDAGAEVQDRIA